ncbi:hypothetical protein [Nitratireductor sp. GZWM139]|uniref:hypothetical protein n=1 Tax=Nitratireductor sp. GZWM139 TaxID=2950541 RepID=UPI0024BE2123|nr:hypothetical protein [Nitratireductor sp. GZWM139]MDJ1466051.1 hypothetical protein [Nitratireductor sp. GZWM139]
MNILRTSEINKSLEKSISSARLKKYLSCVDNELSEALSQYERNTRLCEAFYTPLQCVEICLRNTVHERMSQSYGASWMTNGGPKLTETSKAMITDALTKLQVKSPWPSNDAIVAELKFAFWVGMLGPGYDQTLWRETLHQGFVNGKSLKRSAIHGRFNMIRRFRNRVAHHEPIFEKNLQQIHLEVLDAVNWMCTDTAVWTAHVSRFDTVFSAA